MTDEENVVALVKFYGAEQLAREVLKLRAELEARDEREQFDRAEQDEIDSMG